MSSAARYRETNNLSPFGDFRSERSFFPQMVVPQHESAPHEFTVYSNPSCAAHRRKVFGNDQKQRKIQQTKQKNYMADLVLS